MFVPTGAAAAAAAAAEAVEADDVYNADSDSSVAAETECAAVRAPPADCGADGMASQSVAADGK